MSLEKLSACVIDANMDDIEELVQTTLDAGADASAVLKELIDAMDVVGDKFEEGTLFLPEMLAAGLTMKAGLTVLKPHLVGASSASAGKVMIGTVQGDIHDIGKNLVTMMLEGAGFEVADVGIDVSPEQFVSHVQKEKPQILGLSALLTTTMPAIGETIAALKEAGLRNQLKIMIGGAPVTQEFADKVGADGYATDASGAVTKAREFIGA